MTDDDLIEHARQCAEELLDYLDHMSEDEGQYIIGLSQAALSLLLSIADQLEPAQFVEHIGMLAEQVVDIKHAEAMEELTSGATKH